MRMIRKWMWWHLLLIVLNVVVVHTSYAMYEDQAGEFDWNIQNLGRITHVIYGTNEKRGAITTTVNVSPVRGTARALYVASDERSRVIARIDSKTGSIKWRRILEKDDNVEQLLLTNYGLLSISGAAKNIRLWDIHDGTLVWDNIAYSGKAHQKTKAMAVYQVEDDQLVVVTTLGAFLVQLLDGKIRWNVSFPVSIVISSQVSKSLNHLYIVGKEMKTTLNKLLKVNLSTGKISPVEEPWTGHVGLLLPLNKSEEESDEIVAVTVHPTSIDVRSLAEDKLNTMSTEALNLKDKIAGVATHFEKTLILRLTSGQRVVCKILKSLAISVESIISNNGIVVEVKNDIPLTFQITADVEKKKITVQSLGNNNLQHPIEWASELDVGLYGGDVATAFVGCSSRKKESSFASTASSIRCRALLIMQDDAMVMTMNQDSSTDKKEKSVVWVREESLANVKEIGWITPAETDLEKQPLKRIPSFMEELKLEIKHVGQLFDHLSSIFSSSFREERVASLEHRTRKEPVNAHFFGLSKYILLLTESGRLFAIRAETNIIAWSIFAGPEYRLLVMRDQPAFGAGAEVLLISNSSKMVWIDGDNGKVLESKQAITGDHPWIAKLPKRKHHVEEDISIRRRIALVSSSSLQMHVFPEISRSEEHAELDKFYFYRFDNETNAFYGYVAVSDATEYKASPVWSIVLPSNQTVVGTCHQKIDQVIDSSVTITGDDSLLVKYLNPHMFGFATESQVQNDETGGIMPMLHVSLVDSITGRLIHQVRHVYGSGPVSLVQSENWVVYSFWNAKEKRTELVSLALFDGAVGTHNLNPWKRPLWSNFRSSYDPRPPFVLQKAFVYPSRIRSLGVTVTSRGITPQFVLVGMENGQIFKLARNYIDPRQTESPPTPEEQSEGLLQYSPLVPVYNNPQLMISYSKSIANIKAISTSPVELESTTLVFAYGLDLFYTRLAPAKTYDMLPSDFNYEMLVLLCIGFLFATIVSRNFAYRKTLHEAWK